MADRRNDIYKDLRKAVINEINQGSELKDEELIRGIDSVLDKSSAEYGMGLKERTELKNRLFNSFRRLDVLQELKDDKSVTEIMINSPKEIFIEKNNRIERWELSFENSERLENIIQQIVSRINRRVNTSHPIADARLPDGSRVHIVLPPIALKGPTVTIRKFPEPIDMDRMIRSGTISAEAAEFLKLMVRTGYNIFISGGTSSGKSTFLNALTAYIPSDERVITIEDSAELRIRHVKNLVSMETRDANSEGDGEVNMSMLIKASLRMRPECIKIKKGKLKRKKKRIPIPHTFLQHILGNLIPLIRGEVVKIIEEADDLLSLFHSVLHIEGILPIYGVCAQHSFPE